MTPRAVRDRLYADFLLPPRWDVYESLLRGAQEAGYRLVSVEELWALIRTDALEPAARYLVLRHDIDTDPAGAASFWRIEQGLGVTASYFFRRSTLDLALMDRIARSGAHVSYHFEELATVAKRRRLKRSEEMAAAVPEARELFARNVERLRSRTGLAIDVVASHGDFVNRRLGMQNLAILADETVRQVTGISLETNDDAFMQLVSSRHSDSGYPTAWVPDDPASPIRRGDPLEALAAGRPVVYLLTHPRQWQANWRVNAREDLVRLRDGLHLLLPTRPGAVATPADV